MGPAGRVQEIVWVRFAGALVVGFSLVRLAVHAWSTRLFERATAESSKLDSLADVGLDEYALREKLFALLDVANSIGVGARIAEAASLVVVMLMLARGKGALRLPASVACLAFVTTAAAWLRGFSLRFFEPAPEPASSSIWDWLGRAGELGAWAAAMSIVIVLVRASSHVRRRRAALACAGVGSLVIALYVQKWFPAASGTSARWWATILPLLHVRVLALVSFIASLGLGLGLWLAATPRNEGEARGFDELAAGGLLVARAASWWRAGLAVGTMALAIAGTMALQRAQRAAFLGERRESVGTPWMLDAAAWLGYLEVGIGLVLALGLATCVLQRRSARAAGLLAVGTVLILTATVCSFGLAATLHDAVRDLQGGGSRFGWSTWGGSGMARHAELTLELEPTLRWIGLSGMTCALAGLAALLRDTSGASPIRAIRFLTLAVGLTVSWLHGRDALDSLGSGVLLLAPVVLGAAIWMLLDLTAFLGEVAEALAPKTAPAKAASSPDD